MGKSIDLTGKRFGRLLVEYELVERKHGEKVWRCICDCGNYTDVTSSSLRYGKTKSCRCYEKESRKNRNVKDLIGKRFGNLVVKCDSGKRNQWKVIWRCLCDCGNEIDVISTNLIRLNTKSCGCLRESLISSELKKYFIENYNAKTEYRIFKSLDTNFYLPYDIYIPIGNKPDINGIYIEINGIQHYKLNGFHKLQANSKNSVPEDELLYQKERDKLKIKFARKNGTYIEIDLRKISTLEMAIRYTKNILIEKKTEINKQKEKNDNQDYIFTR